MSWFVFLFICCRLSSLLLLAAWFCARTILRVWVCFSLYREHSSVCVFPFQCLHSHSFHLCTFNTLHMWMGLGGWVGPEWELCVCETVLKSRELLHLFSQVPAVFCASVSCLMFSFGLCLFSFFREARERDEIAHTTSRRRRVCRCHVDRISKE